MKKLKFLVLLVCITTFIGLGSVNATTYTVEELGEQIHEANPDGNFGYIIGEYVFTSKITLKTVDIMLASRSINAVDTNGKTNEDDIYNEMVMYFIQIVDYDADDKPIWGVNTYLSANNAATPSSFDINYIDYIDDTEYNRYEVKFMVDGTKYEGGEARVGTLITAPAEDPTKSGYIFTGWVKESTTTALNEGTDVVPVDGVTYVATWKKIINTETLLTNALLDINSTDYEVSYDDEVITFIMKNPIAKAADTTGTGLVIAIRNILKINGVESVTITYNDTDYVMDNYNLVGGPGEGSYVMLKLAALLSDISGKNYDTALLNDLIGAEFSITINLDDTAISQNGEAEETYNVELTGTKASESEINAAPLTNASDSAYWTYINDYFAGYVGKTSITIDSNLKVTGRFEKENIEGFAAGGVKTEGYYFAYTVELPTGLTKDDVPNMILKSGNKVLDNNIFDTNNGWVAIIKLADDGSTNEVSFTIDWDGTGSDYVETTHTFDLSEVIYASEVETDLSVASTNVPQVFTITTVANNNAGKMVLGTYEFVNPADESALTLLEYLEINGADAGTWFPLAGSFGPETGYPLTDLTTDFRATFNTAGTYEFIIKIVDVSDPTIIYQEIRQSVTVSD